MKKMPIGIDNFYKLVDQNYYIVDKSLFIKVIVEEGFCEDCIFSTNIDNCHTHQCCFEIDDKIKFVAFKRLQ